jgi:2-iminoacetate synthase ThiH
MKKIRERAARAWERAECQWLLVALGLLVIAGLLYAVFETASEHMEHALEVRLRASQYGYNPSEATPAARLQAGAP